MGNSQGCGKAERWTLKKIISKTGAILTILKQLPDMISKKIFLEVLK